MTGEQVADAASPLLEVRDLRTHFFTADGVVKAVDGVDLRSTGARWSAWSASRARARA